MASIALVVTGPGVLPRGSQLDCFAGSRHPWMHVLRAFRAPAHRAWVGHSGVLAPSRSPDHVSLMPALHALLAAVPDGLSSPDLGCVVQVDLVAAAQVLLAP